MDDHYYEISKVLSALAYYKSVAENDKKKVNYNYIDKVANASSKDMALYYLREALRDFSTLKSSDEEMQKALERLLKVAGDIDYSKLESELNELEKSESLSKLRQMLSKIGAEALLLGNQMFGGGS